MAPTKLYSRRSCCFRSSKLTARLNLPGSPCYEEVPLPVKLRKDASDPGVLSRFRLIHGLSSELVDYCVAKGFVLDHVVLELIQYLNDELDVLFVRIF